jgi:tetratricopeptide (TPR) repeat protein
MIGILHNELGEYDQAAKHLQQALTFTDTLGDPRWQAYVLLNLAVTAKARGSCAEALRYLQQTLAKFHQADDQHGISRARKLAATLTEDNSPPPGETPIASMLEIRNRDGFGCPRTP